MTTRLTRREFVQAGAAATLAGTQAPTVMVPSPAKPVVIASANGNVYTNGGTRAGVATAVARNTAGARVSDHQIKGLRAFAARRDWVV